ncbi:MAG: response regulator transcription factor [Candidatus Lambdaproteobacteria bacterium]|nr:response regulator transcription factor [Candidatus Lambdaproteobacteria bacterium]
MAKEQLLVIEDEEDLLELIRFNLEREGYRITAVATGEAAVRAAETATPDLVLLDLMLPGMDGLEVCRLLRRNPRTAGVPIMMVTAKGEEADIVAGLELGASDYVTKPFSPRVLVARVRVVLRSRTREPVDEAKVLHRRDVTIHPGRREVRVGGEITPLTHSEFLILHFLARRPGWVFTRGQIVDAVRGDDYPVTDRSVDVQLVGLRRKLGAAGTCIETVRGVGYRFKE